VSTPLSFLPAWVACALLCAAAAVAHAAEPSSAASARAAEPFIKHNVVLLQPSAVLEARVSSVDAMAEYIRAVEAAAMQAVRASASQRPAAGFIVIAVRPGPYARVWLDFDAPPPAFDTSRALVANIAAVKPFEVRDGPVVFALKVGLWDAFESKRLAPSPAEWKAATKKAGRQLEIDALIEQVWRD
jgi:hypothetical protein